MNSNEKKVTKSTPQRRMSRRRFLEIAGAAAAGFVISRCTPNVSAPPNEIVPGDAGVATATPDAAAAVEEAATPVPGAEGAGKVVSKVAVGQADTYDRALIRSKVEEMVDNLGGLGDVVRPGDRVVIKTNLTGGTANKGQGGLPAVETFVTHPEVVRALAELVRDAGAGEIFVVEAVYQWGSYVEWGYEEIAKDLDIKLVDLNATDPYGDYAKVAVPSEGEIYQEYIFNPILEETDVFMSVAKMKCHDAAGVTHALKNLIGLVPARFYQLSSQHNHRSEFHGSTPETAGHRLPRIITELNRARPIHFALIDGVKTTEGGEGPWIQESGPIAPGVLFAGKDPVATDTVATAAQGFDPTAAGGTVPFIRSDNHLQLAAEHGLGTNRLDEIEVAGPSIEDVKVQFEPAQ